MSNMYSIGFENYKLFKSKTTFEFKNITLFTGTNNSGKSSIINGLEFLKFNNIDNKNGSYIGKLLQQELKAVPNKNRNTTIKSLINKTSEANYFNYYITEGNIEHNFKVLVADESAMLDTAEISEIGLSFLNSQNTFFKLSKHQETIKVKINFNALKNEFEEQYLSKLAYSKEVYQAHQTDILDKITSFEKEEISLTELSECFEIFNTKYNQNYWVFKYIQDNRTYVVYVNSNIDDFYEESETDIITDEKILNKNIIDEIIDLQHFTIDFNRILKNDIESLKKLNILLKDYYNQPENVAYKLFVDDLINYLSDIEWHVKYSDSPIETETDKLNARINGRFLSFEAVLKQFKYYGLEYLFLNTFKERYVYIREQDSASIFADSTSIIISSDKNLKKNFTRYFNVVVSDKIENVKFEGLLKEVFNLTKAFFEMLFEQKESESKSTVSEKPNKEKYSNLLFPESEYLLKPIVEFNKNGIKNEMLQNFVKVPTERALISRSYNLNETTVFEKILHNFFTYCIKSGEGYENISFINKWLSQLGIAEEIIFDKIEDTNEFKIYLKKDGERILLSDYGLGTNQILPIIIAACSSEISQESTDESGSQVFYSNYSTNYPVLLIEEPEANLHPSLQSKLADFFVELSFRFRIKLIIETHSEYLIRKLQYLVASNNSNLHKNDVIIHYLYPPNHPDVLSGEVKQVEKIEIDEEGFLSKEFGTGFFDEAQKIAISLFGLNQSQKN